MSHGGPRQTCGCPLLLGLVRHGALIPRGLGACDDLRSSEGASAARGDEVPQQLLKPRQKGQRDLVPCHRLLVSRQMPDSVLPVDGHRRVTSSGGKAPQAVVHAPQVRDRVGVRSPRARAVTVARKVKDRIPKYTQTVNLQLRKGINAACMKGVACLQDRLHAAPVAREVDVAAAAVGRAKVAPEQVVHRADVAAGDRQTIERFPKRAPLQDTIHASALGLDAEVPELQQRDRRVHSFLALQVAASGINAAQGRPMAASKRSGTALTETVGHP
mmetsp:Transcript_13376/g.39061  ORF Transcript_13376/g.39061 Transcript_13376/m.39061 type:complete len:273 (-) Transcript_13376:2-820(-)